MRSAVPHSTAVGEAVGRSWGRGGGQGRRAGAREVGDLGFRGASRQAAGRRAGRRVGSGRIGGHGCCNRWDYWALWRDVG